MMKRYLWLAIPACLLVTACAPSTPGQSANGAAANNSSANNPAAIGSAASNTTTNTTSNVAAANGTPTNGATNGATNGGTSGATNSIATGAGGENGNASSAPITWVNRVVVTAHTYKASSQDVVYPQLSGLPNAQVQTNINSLLKKNSLYTPSEGYTNPATYTYTASYNVVFQQGDIMNFMISTYFSPKGAAHGMPSRTSLIVNVKTGQVYQLKDLFQLGSNYLPKVSQVVANEDTTHALDTFAKFTGVTNKDTIYLRSGGFVVDFAPYEWASYAQGFLDYPVSFASVDGIINKSGSFWQALTDKTGFSADNHRTEEQAKITSLGYKASLEPEDSTNVQVGQGNTLSAWVGTKDANNGFTTATTYVFFFLNGKYLGTDTAKPHDYTRWMAPSGNGTISVSYQNYVGNVWANPFTIHYSWNGSKLIAQGTFPHGFGQGTG
ncbi:LppP/LprE family lipoprotein [Alicyclobacillus curvatus]|nr:LppP/LprE family lipoprotein [Alicyclobacillus curvatus]